MSSAAARGVTSPNGSAGDCSALPPGRAVQKLQRWRGKRAPPLQAVFADSRATARGGVAVGLILIARDAAWQADLWMFHLVNGWSGNWVLDWGAIYASKTYLLNGAIIMAAYWWVWFLPGPDQDRRTKIISALIAAIITLIVARALASVLPFRLRPLSAPGIGYHGPNLPSGQNITRSRTGVRSLVTRRHCSSRWLWVCGVVPAHWAPSPSSSRQ